MQIAVNIDDSNYIEIRDKILKGINEAIKNLIEERKKTNGELVTMVKGEIKHVPAKDL